MAYSIVNIPVISMKPGLEAVLDLVLTTDKAFYMLDHHDMQYMDRVVAEVKEDFTARPEHYLTLPKFKENQKGIWEVLESVGRQSHYEAFDLMQKKLFPLHLCETDGRLGVYERPRGSEKKITNTLRSTVETLRSMGIAVKWPKEKTIHRYARAYNLIGHEIYHRARRYGNKDRAEIHEAWVNSPG